MTLHCVGNYEQNLYHDSYFWSVFWDDEEKKLTHQEVGATAYAGGACRTALTTDENVWNEANAYKDQLKNRVNSELRKIKADRIRKARADLKKAGVHTAFSRKMHIDDLEDVAAIFNPRVRNGFKLKMRDVVRNWTPGGAYETPLSKNQMGYIRRPMTDPYGRENALSRKRCTMHVTAILHVLRGFGAR